MLSTINNKRIIEPIYIIFIPLFSFLKEEKKKRRIKALTDPEVLKLARLEEKRKIGPHSLNAGLRAIP